MFVVIGSTIGSWVLILVVLYCVIVMMMVRDVQFIKFWVYCFLGVCWFCWFILKLLCVLVCRLILY